MAKRDANMLNKIKKQYYILCTELDGYALGQLEHSRCVRAIMVDIVAVQREALTYHCTLPRPHAYLPEWAGFHIEGRSEAEIEHDVLVRAHILDDPNRLNELLEDDKRLANEIKDSEERLQEKRKKEVAEGRRRHIPLTLRG